MKRKLLIAIPAYNEKKSLPEVIQAIPAHFEGIDEFYILVVDDGSNDGTDELMKKLKIHSQHFENISAHHTSNLDRSRKLYLMRHPRRLGLAQVYNTILKTALNFEVDFLVHFDADGQYQPTEIELLLKPLLKNEADLVVGDRQIHKLHFMKTIKKYGNLLGSSFLQLFIGKTIRDVSSGFRALNKKAITVLAQSSMRSSQTYTHESLIIAKFSNLKMLNVPITFKARQNGKSRLIGNVLKHIFLCLWAIFSTWLMFCLKIRKAF